MNEQAMINALDAAYDTLEMQRGRIEATRRKPPRTKIEKRFALRKAMWSIIVSEYRDVGTLPTPEGIAKTLSTTGLGNKSLEKSANRAYENLESQGIVTPEGEHTGRRHLTEKGFEMMGGWL